MRRRFDEVRQLAMQLPESQRLALALDLSADVTVHPGLGEPEPGYEEWFRAGVEEALLDTSEGIPHNEVVSDIANVLRSAREARLKASA
jgi:hypothetical protein